MKYFQDWEQVLELIGHFLNRNNKGILTFVLPGCLVGDFGASRRNSVYLCAEKQFVSAQCFLSVSWLGHGVIMLTITCAGEYEEDCQLPENKPVFS